MLIEVAPMSFNTLRNFDSLYFAAMSDPANLMIESGAHLVFLGTGLA